MPGQTDFEKQARSDNAPEIPPDLVIASLDAMVSSTAFGKAKRPARFLRHLVETALRGEAQLLKESLLGIDVFDRPPSWDPRLDPVVRQEAARLRKRLASYYETSGADAEVRIELPVGSYVPMFQRRKKAPETPIAVENPPPPRPLMWPYLLAGIVCVAAILIAWRTVTPEGSPVSIVVLPFTDLSANASEQYFADGLTDEITDSLARLKTLRVIARSSAFRFRGKSTDIREVGRLLHVSNVLEGSVERAGNRIRIIAHLERVSDGSLIWSNRYESDTPDLFALQSELAAGIAGNLKAVAPIPTAKHIPTSEAHDTALKARYDMQQMTTSSLARAEEEYHQAIHQDPQYASAYLGLGTALYNRFAARGSTFQSETERHGAEQYIRKALELDPDLPTAHAMLAALIMQYDWDWARAERELQAAVAGSSSSSGESYYSFFLIFRGRFAEADRHLQRMLDLDPFSTATMNNLMVSRNLEGRFAEAREASQRLAAQYPQMLAPQEMIGGTYIEEGHPEMALPIFRALEPHFPQISAFEAMAYAAQGNRAEALRLIRPDEKDYSNSGLPMQWFALVYSLLGDDASALKWLERSADRHEWQALSIGIHPVYSRMRNTAGFRALKARIGL